MTNSLTVSYVCNSFDDKVAELLKSGGVGFMPSDTIYGLSARALDEAAVEKVHKLKKRDAGKPCIVLISKAAQLKDLGVIAPAESVTKKYWPGALSIECDATRAPDWLHRGTKAFAVRLPDYPELQELINKVGPIVSTSANLQGESPINDAATAKKQFGEALGFYVDVGKREGRAASTLIVIKHDKIQIVRPGAVKINEEE